MRYRTVSTLHKNRPVYFKFGLIIALSAVILAFNHTVPMPLDDGEAYESLTTNTLHFEVVRTAHPQQQKKSIPPPETKVEIIKPLQEISFHPEPLMPEVLSENTTQAKSADERLAAEKVAPPLPDEKASTPDFWKVVEQMPRFGDCHTGSEKEKIKCTEATLLQYIYTHLKYPDWAIQAGIQGTVVAEFKIAPDGQVVETQILRDIGGGCGDEVRRILSAMPEWTPGKMQGRPVKVLYRIPVRFKLE